MDSFFPLIEKLAPLYGMIFLGVFLGRLLKVEIIHLGKFLFYGTTPFIIFTAILPMQINKGTLSLPFLIFTLCSSFALIFYYLLKNTWKDERRNIMAYCAGTGNSGYFGLPLAILFFDEQTLGAYTLTVLGMILFENTLGFYLAARRQYSSLHCIKKLAYLPSFHAFIFALTLNYYSFSLPQIIHYYEGPLRALHTLLGMFMIGIGLSSVSRKIFDPSFISLAFFCKFLLWPLSIIFIIKIESLLWGQYTPNIHNALFLIAIVPLPANAIVISNIFNLEPEKTACVIILSTLFGAFYIPVMSALWGL